MPSLPALDIKSNINHSPHVVLLGAGASLAAFPNGDKNGIRLPLMCNFIQTVGLEGDLEKYGVNENVEDFEAFYDDLVSSCTQIDLVKKIEDCVYHYFASMELPDKLTIYDYLILSLRKTDLIATFNWDPFLAQTYRRNMHITEPPCIAFLHGNVEISVCREDRGVGFYFQKCSKCGKPLEPSQLLYPVKHKNYQSDEYIKSEWTTLQRFLEHAYYVTIFGYSAPSTDIEAKSLMLNVWKKNTTVELAEIDIIDTKNREELEKTWEEFFVRNHYAIRQDVFQSYLFTHPRRSCEAFAMATLQQAPWKSNPWPKFKKLEDLHRWIQPLLREEMNKYFTGKPVQ